MLLADVACSLVLPVAIALHVARNWKPPLALRRRKTSTCTQVGLILAVAAVTQLGTCATALANEMRVETVRFGGTLSLTGPEARDGLRTYNALLLMQKVIVERNYPFSYHNGTRLNISLDFKDDSGNYWEAYDLYEQLFNGIQDAPDFLIGPSSYRMAMQAMTASIMNQRLLMLTSSPIDQLYQQDMPYTFSTNVMAPDYMTSALDMLRSQGYKTLTASEGIDVVDQVMCQGAMDHARKIGFEILENNQLTPGDVSVGHAAQIRKMKAQKPDLFVSCGSFGDAVQTVLIARALGFSPRGMLIVNANGQEFISAVGAPNANYILAPTSWSSTLQDTSCKVFGPQGAAAFATRYFQEYGEHPSYESAQAAAGIVALLHAVANAGTKETEQVREALLNLDVSSFYRRLKFQENGTLESASVMYTEQVQPDFSVPKMLQYNTSITVVVAGGSVSGSVVGQDMPDWDQKEAEVYPCRVGASWELSFNGSFDGGGYGGSCVACDRGRFRGPHITFCKSCEVNTYAAETGMDQCLPCPEGANCTSSFGTAGRPNASDGYYLFADLYEKKKTLLITPCNPPELCVGADACIGTNTGVMCLGCDLGTTNTGLNRDGKICEACPDLMANILGVALLVSVYGIFIAVLVKAQRSSTTSIRAIHSVISKICVNYLHFAGTAFASTQFLEEMVPHVFGGDQHQSWLSYLYPIVSFPKAIASPISSLVSMDCLIGYTGFKKYQVYVVVGLLLMPFTFVLQFLVAIVVQTVRKITSECRSARQRDLEDRLAMSECSESGCPSPSAFPWNASPGGHCDPTSPSRTPGTRSYQGSPTASARLPWTPSRITMRQMKGRIDVGRITAEQIRKFIQTSIVCGFVLHPLVVDLLLVSFKCLEYDTLRLKGELDVKCNSDEHLWWTLAATGGLIVYGLGFPLVLFILLYRRKTRLLQQDTIQKYGFLYNGFEIRYYYFESFYMLRKVVILLLAAAPTMYVRMVGMASAAWTFVLLHLYTEPFDNRSFHCLDMLETLNLMALTVTLMSRLIFDMRNGDSGDWFNSIASSPLVGMSLLAVPVFCHLWFMGFASWCLFRNSVVKYLILKAELRPGRVTRLQRFIISLDRPSSKVVFDKERQAINIEGLSKRDRKFLSSALTETLARYVGGTQYGVPEVRPGLVAAAVQVAFQRCRFMRDRRRADLAELDLCHHGDSWFDYFLRVKDEMRMSLQGLQQRAQDYHNKTRGEFESRTSVFHAGVTVEELHEALMLVWPEITNGANKYSGTVQDSLFRLLDERSSCVSSECNSEVDMWEMTLGMDQNASMAESEREDMSFKEMKSCSLISRGTEGMSDTLSLARQATESQSCKSLSPERMGSQSPGSVRRERDELLDELMMLRKANADLRTQVPNSERKLPTGRAKSLGELPSLSPSRCLCSVVQVPNSQSKLPMGRANSLGELPLLEVIDENAGWERAITSGDLSTEALGVEDVDDVEHKEDHAKEVSVADEEEASEGEDLDAAARPRQWQAPNGDSEKAPCAIAPTLPFSKPPVPPALAIAALATRDLSRLSQVGRHPPVAAPSPRPLDLPSPDAMPTLLSRLGESSPQKQLRSSPRRSSLSSPRKQLTFPFPQACVEKPVQRLVAAPPKIDRASNRRRTGSRPSSLDSRVNSRGADLESGRSSCGSPAKRSNSPQRRPRTRRTPRQFDTWPGDQSLGIAPEVQVAAAAWSGPFEFLRAMRPADPAGLPRVGEGA